jgi:hypothetical protein
MMGFLVGFVTGSFFGVYMAQKYNVINIDTLLLLFKEKLKEYEKGQKESK